MFTGKDPRSVNKFRGSHAQLQELEREQRTTTMLIRYALVLTCFVILAVLISGQAYPKDRAMRIQANRFERAIQQYYAEEMDYPDQLADVSQYILLDGQWPKDPYAGRDIVECGSEQFNAAYTVGMLHYERLDSGDSTGYKLLVFGRKGVLDTRWGGQTR